MYLFSRAARLGPGNLQDQMAWSLQITEKVNQVTELDVSLWTTVFSPKLGTLVWTAAVEDLSVLEASDAKLFADSGYLALVDDGAKFSSGEPIDDALLNVVAPDPDAANIQLQYASVVTSAIAPGKNVRGIELGVEIAQRVKKITGNPTSFAVATTGQYGGVEWISVFESIEQLQAADAALAVDEEFAKYIDKEASEAYVSTVTTQNLYRRIA